LPDTKTVVPLQRAAPLRRRRDDVGFPPPTAQRRPPAPALPPTPPAEPSRAPPRRPSSTEPFSRLQISLTPNFTHSSNDGLTRAPANHYGARGSPPTLSYGPSATITKKVPLGAPVFLSPTASAFPTARTPSTMMEWARDRRQPRNYLHLRCRRPSCHRRGVTMGFDAAAAPCNSSSTLC